MREAEFNRQKLFSARAVTFEIGLLRLRCVRQVGQSTRSEQCEVTQPRLGVASQGRHN